MFKGNTDIIRLAEKEFNNHDEFIEHIKNDDLRKELAKKLASSQLSIIKNSLSEVLQKFTGDIIINVIDFALTYYISKNEKINLSKGLMLFYSSPVIIKRIKNYLAETEILKSRSHILIDALDAHVSGKYNLSVPLLIIHLRGLLDEFCMEPKITKMESNMPGMKGIKVTGLCINIPVKAKGKYMNDTCSEILRVVDSFISGKRKDILSGNNLTYGNIETSTELVMFLSILLLGLGMNL